MTDTHLDAALDFGIAGPLTTEAATKLELNERFETLLNLAHSQDKDGEGSAGTGGSASQANNPQSAGRFLAALHEGAQEAAVLSGNRGGTGAA